MKTNVKVCKQNFRSTCHDTPVGEIGLGKFNLEHLGVLLYNFRITKVLQSLCTF